jgi:outer membrane protein assembly factor BamB
MRLALFVLTIGLAGLPISGQEPATPQWSRFRGPNGSGVSDRDKPPTTFGPATNRLWQIPAPPGHSSPTVWNDLVFLTGVEDNALVLAAYRRRDGTRLWQQRAPAETLEKVHTFSSPAASTPATDGERVYAYFGSYGLLAYDLAGKELWRKPLPAPPTQYGSATSPIVFDGKVILQLDGNDGHSAVMALDPGTGDLIWRTARPLQGESWSTPTVWTHDGGHQIITVGTGRVSAYAASDGAERWWVGGLTLAPITVAVAGDGLLFASSQMAGSESDPLDVPSWDTLIARYDGDKDGQLALTEPPEADGVALRREVAKEAPGNFLSWRQLLGFTDADKSGIITKAEFAGMLASLRANEDNVIAIRPGGKGDSTASHIAWKATRGIAEMPSPLLYRGRLYFVRDGGMVTSYAADSGTVMLDRQRLGALGQYAASPIAADGRIYASSEAGTIVVFRAGDTLDVLARNDLGESITATPAIAADTLYVRTARHLWAFGS